MHCHALVYSLEQIKYYQQVHNKTSYCC